jgi:hypothetical protein
MPTTERGPSRTRIWSSAALLALLALTGCAPSGPTLSVKSTSPPYDGFPGLLDAKSFHLDISYQGPAETAYLLVEAYHHGQLTQKMREVAGVGFSKPVDHFSIRPFINILDSKNGRFVIRTPNPPASDFYLITSATKSDETTVSGPDTAISQDALDLNGGWTSGTYGNFDLSRTYIPIFYIAASRAGGIISGAPPITDGHMALETNQDYLIFYLQVHKAK